MRFKAIAIAAAAAAVLTAPAFAELQNVEVGGSLRIMGNYYTDGQGTFDEDTGFDSAFVEQRTMLNVTADFTDDVTVFVEMDAYNIWGDSNRELAAGLGSANGPDGVEMDLYQGYVEMREAWGQPLTIRIGRQEVIFGSEWIFGNNDTASGFTGLSHDGVTARYDFESGSVTAMALKLVEGDAGSFESDGDADSYGLYGSYTGIENHTIDAYYVWVRDASGVAGNPFGVGGDEDTNLHTVGARAAGTFADAFDYEVEAAFQFGETAEFGGADADFEGWAGNAEIGYTFDNEYNLRIFGGVAYFEGPDGGDIGFNRLFSDWEYSEFLGNTDLSNIVILRGGISAQATESIGVSGVISWFEEEEEPTGTDEGLGWEIGLYATYTYSEDLSFSAGYAHFFTDDDVEDGTLVNGSGTVAGGGGPDSDDLDYFMVETSISF